MATTWYGLLAYPERTVYYATADYLYTARSVLSAAILSYQSFVVRGLPGP